MPKLKEVTIKEIKDLFHKNETLTVTYTLEEFDENHIFVSEMQFINFDNQLKITKETFHHFEKNIQSCPLCHKHKRWNSFSFGTCSFLSKNKTMLERQLQHYIQKHKSRIKLLVAGMRIK